MSNRNWRLKQEIGYRKKGPAHHTYDYSKARYIHPDRSVCRSEQQKEAEKELHLPDLPTTVSDTSSNLNDEWDIQQNLPVEMTTSHRESSLTVETTSETSTTNVQKDNLALNVEMVIGNNPVATNVALNVETDKETQNDGRSQGLNVETSVMDNSQQPVENDVRGLKR